MRPLVCYRDQGLTASSHLIAKWPSELDEVESIAIWGSAFPDDEEICGCGVCEASTLPSSPLSPPSEASRWQQEIDWQQRSVMITTEIITCCISGNLMPHLNNKTLCYRLCYRSRWGHVVLMSISFQPATISTWSVLRNLTWQNLAWFSAYSCETDQFVVAVVSRFPVV